MGDEFNRYRCHIDDGEDETENDDEENKARSELTEVLLLIIKLG